MGDEVGRNLAVDAPPRTSSCAKVEDEPWIVHHDPPEACRAEPGLGEVRFHILQQFILHRRRLALHRSCYVPTLIRFCLG